MTPEIEAKLRKFKRLILSYADFKHAKQVSRYVLEQDLHDGESNDGGVLLEALNCSMIVAYCRPFSGNGRSAPDLPDRLLRCLNAEELEVHNLVMLDRNKVLAHSDADWLDVEPVVWSVAGRDLVIGLKGWGLAPLTKEVTLVFRSAADKLFDKSLEERIRLEPELLPYMRVANPENPFA